VDGNTFRRGWRIGVTWCRARRTSAERPGACAPRTAFAAGHLSPRSSEQPLCTIFACCSTMWRTRTCRVAGAAVSSAATWARRRRCLSGGDNKGLVGQTYSGYTLVGGVALRRNHAILPWTTRAASPACNVRLLLCSSMWTLWWGGGGLGLPGRSATTRNHHLHRGRGRAHLH